MIRCTLFLFTFVCVAPSHEGQVSPAQHPTVIAAVGDVPPGSFGRPITILAGPVEDGTGGLGFIGTVSDGVEPEGFFWLDDGIAFLAGDVGATTFNTNGDYGIGSLSVSLTDPFAVQASPFVGERVLLSHRGVVQQDGEEAPGLPPGKVIQFVADVQMNAPGGLFWRALFIDGGQRTAFYRSLNATAAGRELVLIERDFIGKYEIRAVNREFHVSDNGANHVHNLLVKPPTQGQRSSVYFNGEIKLIKGQAVPGTGETWQSFGEVVTNNAGAILGEAETNGALDDVLFFNGRVVQREGDVVDGIELTPPAAPRDLLLTNDGEAAYIWAMNGVVGPYHLFHTSNTKRFSPTTRLVVSEKTWLDTDGDGNDDVFLNEFLFKKRTIAFGSQNNIYVLAEILEQGVFKDAILSIPLP